MEISEGAEVDRYVVESLIGRGGMASVYRVRHGQLGTVHALKVLELPSRALRERLMAEGKVQARLEHPNVVAVRDVIDAGGMPGLLMDYIAGPPLDRVLERGPLPVEVADAL